MKIISLISRLLDYPTTELYQHRQAITERIEQDSDLREAEKKTLLLFVNHHFIGKLLDWQAEYDALFERGRSLSLLLYEHSHGESRDRGQAMVNLMEHYKAAGLNIGVRELPDYIPLFLEFISTQGKKNAQAWLQDVAPILALLAVRLEKRDSDYAVLFTCLLALSKEKINLDNIREQVEHEKRDDTNKALDKVWQEEAVTFGGDAVNGGCPGSVSKPSSTQQRNQEMPIQFVDAAKHHSSDNKLRNSLWRL